MTTDPLPSGNPYVGPRPFEEADARDGRYYGREREARDLLALVARERLVLFYAQSGAGKSSLLRASLIPGLRDLGFDVLPIARVSGAAPGAAGPGVANIFVYDLILSVNEGLPVEDRAPAEALAKATLAEFLGGEAAGDPDAAARLAPTVLLVDQFEEIVTSRPERWQDRAAFFEQLRDALERLPRLWVVLTLREDFVAPLEPYAELLPNRLRARYYMQRMGQNAALEAVRQPAATYGLPFAAGVAETLVDNLRRVRVQFRDEPQLGEYVEPVQLQVVCYELWQKLPPLPNASPAGSAEQQVPPSPGEAAGGEAEGRMITEADLPLGHIDQALTHFYEDALAEVLEDPAAQAAGTDERRLRMWFDKELITAEGIRNAVARNEQTGRTGSLANLAVDLLGRRYLVRTELRAGGAWVELVHDRFAEPIRESNRAWFARNLNPLTLDAQAWLQAGKPEKKLYTGSQLAAAATLTETSPSDFGEAERAFVQAGQQVEAHRAARRQRVIAWSAAALSVIFIALAAWALWSRGQATSERGIAQENANRAATQEAEAKVAKATAEAERGIAQENANRAAAQEAEAKVAKTTAEAAQAEALAAKGETERLTRGIRADQLTVYGLKVVDESPSLALLLGTEGLREQHDVARTRPYTATRTIYDLGQTAHVHESSVITLETVVGSAQTNVHEILDKVGGVPLPSHKGPVWAVAFSPDGRWLATASEDTTARLWDVTAADPRPTPIVLTGHEDDVVSVAFSPDGRWLATASRDHTARLWDVTAADPRATPIVLTGHEDDVVSVAFSPDSRWLTTASRDTTARLWDVTAADPRANPIVLTGHEAPVVSVAFSPDGRWLATASYDTTARLWDVTAADPRANPIVLTGHEAAVISVGFSPDSHWLATASHDTTARLWDVTAADPRATPIVLHGHKAPVVSVAFSPDGRWLATASYDTTARLWDVTAADPRANPIVLHGHEAAVVSVAFSPDGRWLATASYDTTARLWDVTAVDPGVNPIILHGHEDDVLFVAFNPDGRWLATASYDTTARLWNVTAADPRANPIVLTGHEGSVYDVAFSPDGHWLATASYDTTARLWDVTAADPRATPIVLTGHEGSVYDAAFSPDGRWLATASRDHTARLWDVTAADPRANPIVLTGHEDDVVSVAFSPDGRWLATASRDHTARLWDVTAADPRATPIVLTGHEDDVVSVAFSPDSHWLATASRDHTARLWDVTAADPRATPIVLTGHEAPVVSVAFSPDSRWLATASYDTTARLWDVTAADPRANPIVLTGHEAPVVSVAFSPDGRWLATASYDTTARLWDVIAADPRATPVVLTGHKDWIYDVAFSPDSRWLVTASSDTTARLWDVTAADPRTGPVVLTGHEAAVVSVAFSPDGRWLATASYDTTSRLWTWRVEDLIETTCLLAGRNLTIEEWQRYFQDKTYRQTCPQWPVHPSLALQRRDEARSLAEKGEIASATAKFKEALALDPSLATDPTAAESWNNLCWQGTTWNQTALVLDACETAVKLAPDASYIRDSRGLARALTGNVHGAIADFEFALAQGGSTEFVASRIAWVKALREGKDPAVIFDAAELEALRNE